MIDDRTHTTRFRNCDWIVAWDEDARSHVYLRDADFVIRGNASRMLAKATRVRSMREVDGRRMMIIPGFVRCPQPSRP